MMSKYFPADFFKTFSKFFFIHSIFVYGRISDPNYIVDVFSFFLLLNLSFTTIIRFSLKQAYQVSTASF